MWTRRIFGWTRAFHLRSSFSKGSPSARIIAFKPPYFPALADGGSYNTGNRPLSTRGLVLGYTHTITPNLVNSARIGFNRVHYVSNIPSYGQNYPPAGLQFPGVPNNPLINGLTLMQPSGYRRLGEPGTHRPGARLRTSSSMTHSALSTASIG